MQNLSTGVVIIESPVKDRVTIHIRGQANDHRNIVSDDLLAAHTLTRCDNTACYFDIGKGTIGKHFTQNSLCHYSCSEVPNANIEDVLKQSNNFISACYSLPGDQITIPSVRQMVWSF